MARRLGKTHGVPIIMSFFFKEILPSYFELTNRVRAQSIDARNRNRG